MLFLHSQIERRLRFMAGGETNPLGVRALSRQYGASHPRHRHQPSTIGTFVSSGCIRLTRQDVIELYGRVQNDSPSSRGLAARCSVARPKRI
jgi:lipoprotein-anchoring transpeptidase ErfK/SrfK